MASTGGDVVGIAGCGTMVLPMAECLLAAGVDVWGHDVRNVDEFGAFAPRKGVPVNLKLSSGSCPASPFPVPPILSQVTNNIARMGKPNKSKPLLVDLKSTGQSGAIGVSQMLRNHKKYDKMRFQHPL